MAGKGPAWRPEPPSRETLMGHSAAGGGWVGAGLGRAELLQVTRSETRQDRNLCLAWGAKEKISEGAILLFQQTLVGVRRAVCPGSSPQARALVLGRRGGRQPRSHQASSESPGAQGPY